MYIKHIKILKVKEKIQKVFSQVDKLKIVSLKTHTNWNSKIIKNSKSHEENHTQGTKILNNIYIQFH